MNITRNVIHSLPIKIEASEAKSPNNDSISFAMNVARPETRRESVVPASDINTTAGLRKNRYMDFGKSFNL